ncbi:glycoside hydrolase family 32 protein [Paenibacillus alkaliterrae]|uniref:glycoside hydrolase family 32 protein n=1 Tax=Paenibacillus alkaliterrae TaxID=320909 RepID=UPI001F300441|nr:glycoside hydrolase family 32 protein [Paenibacillus alkaliterrae]MCF2939666.1 glycoside hydrolase family 32 protein [Paenibacillus alkaliterrae]
MEHTTNKHSKHQAFIAQADEALLKKRNAVDAAFRLHYHVMPTAGWMNDPNGMIHFNGDYHLFYQHDPYQAKQGPMHWGHVRSKDLVHWEHLPVALAPSEEYDKGGDGGQGCWSGSAVDDNGTLTLIYTGHVDGKTPEEVQCLATSKDGVIFDKYAANPVIGDSPDAKRFGFRDPKVWKRGGKWYMVVGYGKDGIGKAIVYTSCDLLKWEFAGAAAESDGSMGDMWECPDLFPIGDADKHVLLISPMNIAPVKNLYLSGTFDYESCRFDKQYAEQIDYGFDFYAPQSLLDDKGRRIMIAWMNIWGATMPEQAHGWLGAMTLPRELTLAADGSLRSNPVPELIALRGRHAAAADLTLDEGRFVEIPGVRGDSLELIAVFDMSSSDASEFGLRIRCSEDGSSYTEIRYAKSEQKLYMDRNLGGAGDGGVSAAPLQPAADGRVQLRLFIDRSSVELFANDGRIVITNRLYPDPANVGIKFFARGGSAVIETLDAWELSSIW